ncbi:MAG: hypothetical protein ABI690_00035 [Chloroflexota bacterium]
MAGTPILSAAYKVTYKGETDKLLRILPQIPQIPLIPAVGHRQSRQSGHRVAASTTIVAQVFV